MLKVLTSRIISFAFMLCGSPCYAGRVIVDGGHTPAHPSATGASGRVKHLYNLDMSAAVAHDLQADGYRVTRTGATNREIALADRPNAEPDANLFVSVHYDSILQPWRDAGRLREFKGYSIFVSTLNAHYRQRLVYAKIMGEKLLAAGEMPTLYHATPIRGENRPLIDQRLGIQRFDDLIALKTTPMPAVLAEAGVIANPDEEPRLQNPATIAKIANAIRKG
ncbi:N-acetylmuramoyl-L-alanine amidase [Pseudomonas bohemica]|uniref:N-acetylmuramoyl-L-alanine amidase n=1 Tax=Pseudomonas bohemica TaxID=2044872 RepID=UPI000DA626C3|nr:N-acetylmuramoyl-L-alanine amidase [Pseudomonas bohemica]